MQVIGLVPEHHCIKARWVGLLPSEVRPFRLSLMALPKCRKFCKGFRWFVAIPMCKAHNAKILKRMMMLGDAGHPGKQTKSCTSNKANKVLENTPPFSLQMKSSKKPSRFPSRSWTCFQKQNDSCHKGKTFDDDANTVNINHPMFSSFQPPTKCFSIEHPIHQSNQNTSNLKAASKQLRFQNEIRCNLVIRSKLILSGKSLKTNHGTETKMTTAEKRNRPEMNEFAALLICDEAVEASHSLDCKQWAAAELANSLSHHATFSWQFTTFDTHPAIQKHGQLAQNSKSPKSTHLCVVTARSLQPFLVWRCLLAQEAPAGHPVVHPGGRSTPHTHSSDVWDFPRSLHQQWRKHPKSKLMAPLRYSTTINGCLKIFKLF